MALALFACDRAEDEARPRGNSEFASAVATLTQIQPRVLIDVTTAAAESPDAVTAQWPITGRALFRATRDGVDLELSFESCRTAYAYPTYIYEASDCAEVLRGTPRWPAGELIPRAACLGAPGASVYYSRPEGAAAPWTLGGPARTNVVGRAITVHDPDTLEPLACGTIVAAPDAGVSELDAAALPSPQVISALAGACLLAQVPRAADAGVCPDPARLAECALTHCRIPECLTTCSAYIGCLEASLDVCTSGCAPSEACSSCLRVSSCALGFCEQHTACAPKPTPGGPCTQLKACCMRQGPLVDACLMQIERFERLAGDRICLAGLEDWDFNTNFAYRSPCYPDGGVPP